MAIELRLLQSLHHYKLSLHSCKALKDTIITASDIYLSLTGSGMSTEGNEGPVNTNREEGVIDIDDGQKKDASTPKIVGTSSVMNGDENGALGKPTAAHNPASQIPCRCGCVPPNMMSLFQMAELRAARKKEKLAQGHAHAELVLADATYVKEA